MISKTFDYFNLDKEAADGAMDILRILSRGISTSDRSFTNEAFLLACHSARIQMMIMFAYAETEFPESIYADDLAEVARKYYKAFPSRKIVSVIPSLTKYTLASFIAICDVALQNIPSYDSGKPFEKPEATTTTTVEKPQAQLTPEELLAEAQKVKEAADYTIEQLSAETKLAASRKDEAESTVGVLKDELATSLETQEAAQQTAEASLAAAEAATDPEEKKTLEEKAAADQSAAEEAMSATSSLAKQLEDAEATYNDILEEIATLENETTTATAESQASKKRAEELEREATRITTEQTQYASDLNAYISKLQNDLSELAQLSLSYEGTAKSLQPDSAPTDKVTVSTFQAYLAKANETNESLLSLLKQFEIDKAALIAKYEALLQTANESFQTLISGFTDKNVQYTDEITALEYTAIPDLFEEIQKAMDRVSDSHMIVGTIPTEFAQAPAEAVCIILNRIMDSQLLTGKHIEFGVVNGEWTFLYKDGRSEIRPLPDEFLATETIEGFSIEIIKPIDYLADSDFQPDATVSNLLLNTEFVTRVYRQFIRENSSWKVSMPVVNVTSFLPSMANALSVFPTYSPV